VSGIFGDLGSSEPLPIWDGLLARAVLGEASTLAVIELDPNVAVPEHSHTNEQLGVLATGQMTFTIAGETKVLGPGDTWRILAHVPHSVVAGPDGAVAIESFAPARDDWTDRERVVPRAPHWPK
jgi:quercetin dioxygenase-like cupin family protein